jgi:L-2-amino-thiazoline-4-carboxylic acid hydrolase
MSVASRFMVVFDGLPIHDFHEGEECMPKQGNDLLWIALNDANKGRARIYLEFFRVIAGRYGQSVAIDICKEAIRNWGHGQAGGLTAHLPTEFDGLTRSFVFAPDGGAMFRPRVDGCDGDGLDVQFEACPLKSAWLEAGMAEADVALFCEMASEADYGTLEAAGFSVTIETWKPSSKGCCSLKIRRG